MLQGVVEGFDEMPGTMVDLDCSVCHGEAPEIHASDPEHCVICHGPDYRGLVGRWAEEIDGLRREVERGLAEAAERGVPPQSIEVARRALRAVELAGSRGAHNYEFSQALLIEARRLLQLE